MNDEQKETMASAIGCGFILILVIAIPLSLFMAVCEWFVEANTALSNKRITIEGVVVNIEQYKEEIPQQPSRTPTEKRFRDKIRIVFEDGRIKEFIGTISKPIEKGKYYIITYNGHDCVVDVVEVKNNQ